MYGTIKLVQTKNNKLIYPCRKVVFAVMMLLVMSGGAMDTSQFENKQIDGTPYAVKVACTVWTGGKDGDDFKVLPISIVFSPTRQYQL